MRGKGLGIIVFVLAIIVSGAGQALWKQSRQDMGLRFVKSMGAGINIGNSLDSTKVRELKPGADILYYETYWGNPPVTRELFQAIGDAGFQTVRIPVSWEEHMDEENQVDPLWMARVEEAVNWALDEGMYVILDTHHEIWLEPSVQKEQETTERLCALWAQIAARFAEYGEKLLFEGMNEPRVRESKAEWSGGTEEERQVVNRLNAAFVETVRGSGGENRERYLILAPYGNSYEEEALKAVKLPEDPRLIVAVHAYIPYSFALDEEGDHRWEKTDEKDTERVSRMMSDLERIFIQNKIPVIITEFGCLDKDNEEDRIEWASDYMERARGLGIPCVWWDEGQDFKLIDRKELTWAYPRLKDILVKD